MTDACAYNDAGSDVQFSYRLCIRTFIMRIYCINLASATARRERVFEECQKFGLSVEMIDAVNGKGLSEQELRSQVFDFENNYLTRGEIGCALSHLKVYEKMLANGDNHALVLEDDVLFSLDPRPFIEGAAKSDPDQPLVFLITRYKSYLKNRERMFGDIAFYPTLNANCAHAYVLTRAAARNMLRSLLPVRIVADHWKFFMQCGLVKVWVCEEQFAVQDGEAGGSELEPDRNVMLKNQRRKTYMKRIRAMAPVKNRLQSLVWKIFIRPFEKVVKTD